MYDNREKLDQLAAYLYEKETITGEEFMNILAGCIWPSCPASGAIIPGQSGP